MEFEIRFDADAELALVRTWGRASAEGFSAYLRALVSDPRWHTGMDVLSDHSGLDAGRFTARGIEGLVSIHVPFAGAIGPGLCAVVAGSSLKFGLTRMFEAHAESKLPFRLRVFETIEEALTWLRTSDEEPEPEE
jgi:hypothetical protein